MKTKISQPNLDQVSKIYKIKIDRDQRQTVQSRLESLLKQVEAINRLRNKVASLDEITHIGGLKNVFRKDVIKLGLSQKESLSSANKKSRGYIKTIKIFE